MSTIATSAPDLHRLTVDGVAIAPASTPKFARTAEVVHAPQASSTPQTPQAMTPGGKVEDLFKLLRSLGYGQGSSAEELFAMLQVASESIKNSEGIQKLLLMGNRSGVIETLQLTLDSIEKQLKNPSTELDKKLLEFVRSLRANLSEVLEDSAPGPALRLLLDGALKSLAGEFFLEQEPKAGFSDPFARAARQLNHLLTSVRDMPAGVIDAELATNIDSILREIIGRGGTERTEADRVLVSKARSYQELLRDPAATPDDVAKARQELRQLTSDPRAEARSDSLVRRLIVDLERAQASLAPSIDRDSQGANIGSSERMLKVLARFDASDSTSSPADFNKEERAQIVAALMKDARLREVLSILTSASERDLEGFSPMEKLIVSLAKESALTTRPMGEKGEMLNGTRMKGLAAEVVQSLKSTPLEFASSFVRSEHNASTMQSQIGLSQGGSLLRGETTPTVAARTIFPFLLGGFPGEVKMDRIDPYETERPHSHQSSDGRGEQKKGGNSHGYSRMKFVIGLAELGEVVIDIAYRGQEVTALVVAMSDGAHQWFLSRLPQFKLDLREMGFSKIKVDLRSLTNF